MAHQTLATNTPPIYQMRKQYHFYPQESTDNMLTGEPVLLPPGTAISIVRQGHHDTGKYLVQAGDLLSWIFSEYIQPLEQTTWPLER